MSRRRFRRALTEEEEKNALEKAIPKSTRYATKWAVKIFEEWQSGRDNKDPGKEECSFKLDLRNVEALDSNICNMNAESLNLWLTKFVQEVCKSNGERYPARSLYQIITGLQRYLKESGNDVSLVGKPEERLTIFRKALDAEMKQSTADGVANETKREERSDISEEDERTMWSKGLLGCNTAKCLLRTIYFYNGKLFGIRSKEHRGLRYSNFRVEDGCIIYDESVSKTYHGGLNDLKYRPRVVKHVCCSGKDVNHYPCIVNIYATYLEKIEELSKEIDAFYFKPNPKVDEFTYFRCAVGINTLNKFLPDLCGEAGLKRKTSHCLRVTCATRLFQSHSEEKAIRERTGHRSNALLQYEKMSKEQESEISRAVGPPDLSLNVNECSSIDKCDPVDIDKCDPFDVDMFEFGIPDDILANIPEASKSRTTASTSVSVSASGATFNNCVFNFGK